MRRIIALVMMSVFAVAAGVYFTGCAGGGENRDTIAIKGSDTLKQLARHWADSFMESHPGVTVTVEGGGSGTGFEALINGGIDISTASRKIKHSEEELAQSKGVDPVEFIVARDGIAVVVNRSNSISEITLDQLHRIFTGEYTNWSEAGGSPGPINVQIREHTSGTYAFFKEHVMNGDDYSSAATSNEDTMSIINAVEEDTGAIGYVGLGYAKDAQGRVKMLPVKKTGAGVAYEPAKKYVKNGDYPIARPLHLYTDGQPSGIVKEFIDFSLGVEGQMTVFNMGYVPVN